MLVEDPNGNYLNLRIKHEFNHQNIPYVIRVEMYNKNEFFYTFFFSMTNDIDKFDHKHTYFAVRMSVDDVLERGADNHLPIVDNETDVVIFKENDFLAEDQQVLRNYTQMMSFHDLVELQKLPQRGNINLTFEKVYDNRSSIRFIPLIYQEKKNV